MKQIGLLVLFIVLTLQGWAQVHKRFIDKHGLATTDSGKATSYFLYEKLPDSSWTAVQFNMKNTPLSKCTYLDEELSMMHGKASYYHIVYSETIVAGKGYYRDTSLKVQATGYYLNGRKEGVWVDFFDDGKIFHKRSFMTDTLDGPWEEFYTNGAKYLEGSYVKGQREGDWNLYYPDSTINHYSRYKNGVSVKEVYYDTKDKRHNAYPEYNFVARVFNGLKKSGFPVIKGFVPVSFNVTALGELVNIKILIDDPKLNYAIIEAIGACPKWHSATLKSKAVEDHVTLILTYQYRDNGF